MFWLVILGSAVIIGLLTLVGAAMVRRDPGTDWERYEDRPMIGPEH
ncbi:MAG: hypothetical protein JNJ73_01155 [Hyphomonadaceae bacterium]|nr:hypothetical protein [Hyphomonadaceae bacterium]